MPLDLRIKKLATKKLFGWGRRHAYLISKYYRMGPPSDVNVGL
jgi:hypothetical protein